MYQTDGICTTAQVGEAFFPVEFLAKQKRNIYKIIIIMNYLPGDIILCDMKYFFLQ